MIDPAEAMLAISGLGFLTGERTEAVSDDEIAKARELSQTIVTRAKSTVSQTVTKRSPAPVNFKRTLARLSKLQGVEDHEARAAKFPPGYHRLAAVYNVLLHNLQSEVSKMLPRQTWESIAGTEVGPPTDLDFWKFLNVLQVIDEPMVTFRLIANGQLLKKQALAVKTVFPSLAEAFTSALVEAVVNKKASNSKWLPGWKLNKGLAAWFESSAIPPALLKRLQESHIRIAQQQQQVAARAQEGGAQMAQSPAQHAQFGNVK